MILLRVEPMKIDFRVESCLRYLAQKSGLDTTPRFLVKFFCTRTTIRVQSPKWSKNAKSQGTSPFETPDG